MNKEFGIVYVFMFIQSLLFVALSINMNCRFNEHLQYINQLQSCKSK